jgi:nicotinamidase-related amidase
MTASASRSSAGRTALIVIDAQNDYFRGGAFPLHEAEETAARIVAAIADARAKGVEVIHVQHVADPAQGLAPFFNAGGVGVEIRPDVLAAAPDAPVVVKRFADSFLQTDLDAILKARGVERIVLAGMMTQNCVTHTALSKAAEAYEVSVAGDLATTVSRMLHLIALNALSPRVRVVDAAQAFAAA